MRRALVLGATGQDGSHLSELLLEKGYEVWGLVRPSTVRRNVHPRVKVLYGDLKDTSSIHSCLSVSKPEEIYNLAAQSHVGHSFQMPECTVDIVGLGVVRLLEICRNHCPDVRIYQASSSEMFGNQPAPQNEDTPFAPESPYAIAKVLAHQTVGLYRRAYGMFAVAGIAMNHEGERRPETFVTRKITRAAARIKLGLQAELRLGNIEARRDWAYAPEICRGMWMMLQQDQPRDYVLATGVTHSVREFIQEAFSYLDLDWQKYVQHDKSFERPRDVHDLCGDASLARRELGWETKVTFQELVRKMVDHDLKVESG